MYYQIATELLIVGDQEELAQRALYRGPELALLLNRVVKVLNRRLGINLLNSLESDNPAQASVSLSIRAWTSYEVSLRDEIAQQSNNRLTRLHGDGALGSGTSSPASTSGTATSATPPT